MRELSIEEVDLINGADSEGATVEDVMEGGAGELDGPYANAAIESAFYLTSSVSGMQFKIVA
jgi:hypothetical protein